MSTLPPTAAETNGADGPIPEDWLSAYLDDELAPAERSRVESALERDGALRGRLDELRSVSRWLHTLDPPKRTTDFAEAVFTKPAPSPAPNVRTVPPPPAPGPVQRRGGRVAWAAFGTAVAALLLVFAGPLFNGAAEQDAALDRSIAFNDGGSSLERDALELSEASAIDAEESRRFTAEPTTTSDLLTAADEAPAVAAAPTVGRARMSIPDPPFPAASVAEEGSAKPENMALGTPATASFSGADLDIASRRELRPGDVVEAVEREGEPVVEWLVDDVQESVGQLQLFLSQAGVRQPSGERLAGDGRMQAVYVQADDYTITQVLDQLPGLEPTQDRDGAGEYYGNGFRRQFVADTELNLESAAPGQTAPMRSDPSFFFTEKAKSGEGEMPVDQKNAALADSVASKAAAPSQATTKSDPVPPEQPSAAQSAATPYTQQNLGILAPEILARLRRLPERAANEEAGVGRILIIVKDKRLSAPPEDFPAESLPATAEPE